MPLSQIKYKEVELPAFYFKNQSQKEADHHRSKTNGMLTSLGSASLDSQKFHQKRQDYWSSNLQSKTGGISVIKENFSGSGQAPFIGRFGYPFVNIGVLSLPFFDQSGIYERPKEWCSRQLTINQITGLRLNLINSRQKADIHQPPNLAEICREISMAAKPVDLEVNLKGKPRMHFSLDKEVMPFGPSGEIKKIRITENTKINPAVEKIVGETQLKAIEGIMELYQKGFDEHFLSKLVSVGCLGLKKKRKLVPTRWSITTIDDTLGQHLLTQIKELPLGEHWLYFGGKFGNYYLVLFFSEVWSYELFETYLEKGGAYSTDYENYAGRKNYAENCAGGYYAARLPVLEKMKENKKQNSCLTLRFITPEYTFPLGVWVCREAIRQSLQPLPLSFASKELMLKYAQQLVKIRFGFELNLLLKNSRLLNQKKLNQYF